MHILPISGTLETGLFLALCGYLVVMARPEIVLGMHLAAAQLQHPVFFRADTQTLVLLLALAASFAVCLMRQRARLVPRGDGPVLIWLTLWWGWIVFLVVAFGPPLGDQILAWTFLYIIVPVPVFLLVAADMRRLRRFAAGFVTAVFVGGYAVTFARLDIPIATVLSNPTLSGVSHLGFENYHWLAYAFSAAIILLAPLLVEARTRLMAVGILAALGAGVYMLALAGSRQSIAGALIGVVFFGFWALLGRARTRRRAQVLAGLTLGLMVLLFLASPELVVRPQDTNVAASFNFVENREGHWLQGWEVFADSPVWGGAFHGHLLSHNLFIGALADQGIVGFLLFAGFLFFIALWAWRGWNLPRSDPRAVWAAAAMSIIIFELVHGLASGSPTDAWHLSWAGIVLWKVTSTPRPTEVAEASVVPRIAPASTEV